MEHAQVTPARWRLVALAALLMTLSMFDRQVLAALAPTVTRVFSLSETQYGALSAAFAGAFLLAAPVGGWLVDRFGARRVVVASLLVWTAVAAAHGLAQGFASLLVCRLLLGVAEGPSLPAATQIVQRALPAAQRSRAFGVLFTGNSLGALLAPPLALGLAALADWRVAFAGSALLGLVWLPFWLRSSRQPASRTLLDQPADAVPGVAGLFAVPAVRRGLVLLACISPAIGFTLIWGAKFLVKMHGIAELGVARYLWLPAVMFDVGAIVLGDLASRRARRTGRVGDPALLLAFAAGALTIALVPLCPSPWLAMAVVGLAMAASGGILAMIMAEMTSLAPGQRVARLGGLAAATQYTIFIIANPLVGRSVDRTGGYSVALVAMGAAVVPGVVAWIWSWRAEQS